MYIDNQQDAGSTSAPPTPKGPKELNRTISLTIKNERQGKASTAQEKQPKRVRATRKELQMLRNHAFRNLGSVDVFVNGLASVVAVALIAAAYFSAIGQIALA